MVMTIDGVETMRVAIPDPLGSVTRLWDIGGSTVLMQATGVESRP
jgi:hypothetical protein